MFEFAVFLHTSKLRTLLVDFTTGIVVRDEAVGSCAQVHLVNLQLVRSIQILVWVPQHATKDGLT